MTHFTVLEHQPPQFFSMRVVASSAIPRGEVHIHSEDGDLLAKIVGILPDYSREQLEARLARAEAVNEAHDRGWVYDDDNGSWYDDGATAEQKPFVCLDEDLVSHLAAVSKTP